MAAILNRPMATVHVENTLRIGFINLSTGDAISHFTRTLARFFVDELPLDGKRLSDVREVQVGVELGRCPDLSDFDSPMLRGRMLNEIRLPAVLEP